MDDLTEFLRLTLVGAPGRVVAGVWGALFGSFFNVVILRVPAGESLLRPGSHCRACGAIVRFYDNIPVFSYLLLRGRCRSCGARFSPRYLLVELLVAALALVMHQIFVCDSNAAIGLRAAQFVVSSLFCGLLVALALIDLDTLRIPDSITYPGIPVAMLLSLFMGHPHLWDGPVGGVGGYLVIRLIADGYQLLTGRVGMGYGDAKLLSMIGGLLGWQALLPTLFLAAFQGSLIGISALVILRWWQRRAGQGSPAESRPGQTDEEGEPEEPPPSGSIRHARIPFGPFLSLAAVEILALRRYLMSFFPFLS